MKLGGFAVLDPTALRYYQNGQWSGDDPVACERAGGVVSIWYSSFDARGNPTSPPSFHCKLPPAQAYAPPVAPTTITTTVQTAASPQISPVFVQQDQPKSSPVSAGTVQQSPSPQSASGGAGEDFYAYLKARDEEQAARESKLLDVVKSQSEQGVYVPPPPVTYDAGADNPSSAAVPALQGAPAPGIFAAAAFIIGAAFLMRGKRKGT